MVAQIIFSFLAIGAFWLFGAQVAALRRNILLGRPETIGGSTSDRWRNVLLVAFGQQKMFKKWLPAVLHFCLYAAFLITQIELLEIIADGFFGKHRALWQLIEHLPFAANTYTFIISTIEVLSVFALLATFAFLARRNLLHIPRFQKPEMQGFPRTDANIILFFEIYLVTCIFLMNASDLALQAHGVYHRTQLFAVSQWLAPTLQTLDTPTLLILERVGWWGHILGVFAFLNYLPKSKHLHILLAFPNTYFARLSPKGFLPNLGSVTAEVNPLFENNSSFQPEIALNPQSNNSINNNFSSIGVQNIQENESVEDIFGDVGVQSVQQDESIEDIFGDVGTQSLQQDESVEDIFGDVGTQSLQQDESIEDIFGDVGTQSLQQDESIDDIFGDVGTQNVEKDESVDDIFGEATPFEPVFTNHSTENNLSSSDKTPHLNQTSAKIPDENVVIKFGASDIFDLSWKNLLDAYSCTECGRCTSVCPANLTGKKLSPRKIMMDVRDRATEIGANLDANRTEFIKENANGIHRLTAQNYNDGKNLFDYISKEELRACTTCNACVEACPVLINPLEIILELRRNLILEQSDAPDAWGTMFTNIENNAAPWQFAQDDRAKWAESL